MGSTEAIEPVKRSRRKRRAALMLLALGMLMTAFRVLRQQAH
ncbi:hypothetical protein [Actinomadura harenae]|nr:hypothetical protein [Actinomadura harenae]